MTPPLGQLIRSFFEDYLKVQKGLRPTSIHSYRDTLRLFLSFVSKELRHPITRLGVQDLTVDLASLLSGHNSNNDNWLQSPIIEFCMVVSANTSFMAVFSKITTLRICMIWFGV